VVGLQIIVTLPTDARKIDDNEDGDFVLKAGASPRTARIEALVRQRRPIPWPPAGKTHVTAMPGTDGILPPGAAAKSSSPHPPSS